LNFVVSVATDGSNSPEPSLKSAVTPWRRISALSIRAAPAFISLKRPACSSRLSEDLSRSALEQLQRLGVECSLQPW